MEGHRYIPEYRGGGSALEKNPADLTVMDVYDIAAAVGHEFERIIDQYGCEALSRLMPKVVRVLEILEVMVSRHSIGGPEADELRLELDKLRLERTERLEKERKHRKVHTHPPAASSAASDRQEASWLSSPDKSPVSTSPKWSGCLCHNKIFGLKFDVIPV